MRPAGSRRRRHSACLQLLDHSVAGRQPAVDQVGGMTWTEQPLNAGEQPLVMGMPADPGAGAGGDGLEGAGAKHRALLVGGHHGLLCGQLVSALGRVVGDIAAGDLIVQPER
jgi:hypothetical protein